MAPYMVVGARFRILTWNIRYFSHRSGGLVATDKNIRLAADALGNLADLPDIIALQEVDNAGVRTGLDRAIRRRKGYDAAQLDRLVACLNEHMRERGEPTYESLFFPAHGHQGGLRWMTTGLAILYRTNHRLLGHNGPSPKDITYRRLRSWARFKQKRICAWAYFSLDGRHPLHLFNTHVSLPAFFLRARGNGTGRFGEVENQVIEVDQLLNFARERCREEPAVLVGDFNALPGSIAYDRVLSSGSFRASSVGMPANGQTAQATAGLFGFRYHLDHIFCTASVQTIEDGGGQSIATDSRWNGLSDHRPVYGHFHLTEQAQRTGLSGVTS